MKLQTQIKIQPQNHNSIDYESKILLLGSCFSDNIYDKLSYFKFNALANPFGIQFHAIGIEKLITRAINRDYFSEDELCSRNGLHYSFDAHSSYSAESADVLVKDLNTQLDSTNDWIRSASHVVITLGTSWVYRYIETDSIVSNCHKLPQKQFAKELLSVDTVRESIDAIIELVRSVNSNVSFIFTVSPIRHLKDGFIENNRSKAHLLTAIHQIVNHRNKCYYFPSYEIQMDELRDYRFYKEDMLHPSTIAVDIIWDYFTQSWISGEVYNAMNRVDAIQKGLLHKPFNAQSSKHLQFLENLKNNMENLKKEFPQITF